MVKRVWYFGFAIAIMLLVVSVASAQSDESMRLILVRTNDSITLIVGGNQPANIENLTFEVTTAQGAIITSRRLDSLASFMGIPFNRTPAPSCFHIEVNGSRDPISSLCQPATLFRQVIAPSDRFWLDGLGAPVAINILNGTALMGTCGAVDTSCTIDYTPPFEPGMACENPLNVPMVVVPATEFTMGMGFSAGEPNERPERNVTVDGFCIDVTEVNIGLYAYCVAVDGCEPPQASDAANFSTYYPDMEAYPVVNVTHAQAQALCEFRGGRLPTEAEWELVARYDPESETIRTYPSGDAIPTDAQANFNSDGLVEVGTFPVEDNPYHVQDLSGNAAEWVLDGYAPYNLTDLNNPLATGNQTEFVVRGGSYADNEEGIRGAARVSQAGDSYAPNIGFRCVIPMNGA